MDDIALGVTVFKRAKKLATLLDSIDAGVISRVYIADDGETTETKRDIYSCEYPFDLVVLDLPFDSGLGYGRNKIVDALQEEYMLLLDSDMKMPRNVPLLYDQLQARPDLGGICGLFIEQDRIYTPCANLFEQDGTIVKDIREQPSIQTVAGAPFVEFDFIANAALFRQSCLDEYSWDPEYVIGREHIDFYVGHMHRTDWAFGLCPEVVVRHNPGGSDEFLAHRFDDEKYDRAERYFLEKWGYKKFDHLHPKWIDTYDARFGGTPPHSLYKRARFKFQQEGMWSLLSTAAHRLVQTI